MAVCERTNETKQEVKQIEQCGNGTFIRSFNHSLFCLKFTSAIRFITFILFMHISVRRHSLLLTFYWKICIKRAFVSMISTVFYAAFCENFSRRNFSTNALNTIRNENFQHCIMTEQFSIPIIEKRFFKIGLHSRCIQWFDIDDKYVITIVSYAFEVLGIHAKFFVVSIAHAASRALNTHQLAWVIIIDNTIFCLPICYANKHWRPKKNRAATPQATCGCDKIKQLTFSFIIECSFCNRWSVYVCAKWNKKAQSNVHRMNIFSIEIYFNLKFRTIAVPKPYSQKQVYSIIPT